MPRAAIAHEVSVDATLADGLELAGYHDAFAVAAAVVLAAAATGWLTFKTRSPTARRLATGPAEWEGE